MPLYDYKALSTDGKVSKGIIEADSQKNARLKLKKQGLMATDMVEKNSVKKKGNAGISIFGNGISQADIATMTRQLASLVKANIPLVDAISALVDQLDSVGLKNVLSQVRESVNEGSSLAKALALHPKVFDNIFINMVEAGESFGTLGLVLLRLADLKEAQTRLKRKIVGGMTYPAVMFLVAVGVLIGIFIFVIPKLQQIFVSMNKALPFTTEMLIVMSEFTVAWWPAMILGSAAAFALLVQE